MENELCEEFDPVGLDDEQSAFSIKRSFFYREDFFRDDYVGSIDIWASKNQYTQTTSRFGILALPKPRDSTIVNRSIFLILTGLRSLNRESFGFAKNQILR